MGLRKNIKQKALDLSQKAMEKLMADEKRAMKVADGEEWEPFSGVEPLRAGLQAFVAQAPGAVRHTARRRAALVAVPERLEAPAPARPGEGLSTQAGFGRLLTDMSRQHPELADRIANNEAQDTSRQASTAMLALMGFFPFLPFVWWMGVEDPLGQAG